MSKYFYVIDIIDLETTKNKLNSVGFRQAGLDRVDVYAMLVDLKTKRYLEIPLSIFRERVKMRVEDSELSSWLEEHRGLLTINNLNLL